MGGKTGGTLDGNVSAAAVTIKLDFPVARSPATTIRTPVLPPGLFEAVVVALAMSVRK